MFSEDDFKEWLERLDPAGIQLNQVEIGQVRWLCGYHPFLLERLGFSVVEQVRVEGRVDLSVLQHDLGAEFIDHYEKTTALLEEEGMLSKMLQILFGPVVEVTQVDVEDLLRYGLVRPTEEGDAYHAFSEHFQQYLAILRRNVDLWPLWSQAERDLRAIVGGYLSERHGDNRPERLERARPALRQMLETCREAQRREQATFGVRASANLLDYTFPLNLFEIMATEWNWFRPILRGQPADWQRAFQVLSRVRNPLAHNRDVSVYESDRMQAQGYCLEIHRLVTEWRSRQEAERRQE